MPFWHFLCTESEISMAFSRPEDLATLPTPTYAWTAWVGPPCCHLQRFWRAVKSKRAQNVYALAHKPFFEVRTEETVPLQGKKSFFFP